MKTFTSKTQRTGERGETIACIYLQKQGFTIVERNHTRKWGEIDIIARMDGVLHFIEVKTVSRESGFARPEENMHPAKQRKMARTVASYIAWQNVPRWQCDLICVTLNDAARTADVRMIGDIVL